MSHATTMVAKSVVMPEGHVMSGKQRKARKQRERSEWDVVGGGIACLVLAAALCVGSQTVFGGNITITNNSFELVHTAELGGGQATGWNTRVADSGVFNPADAQFTGTSGVNAQGELPDGCQVGSVWWEPSQNLGVAAKPGATYTVNFYIGWRRDFPAMTPSLRVQLLEGTNAIVNQVVTAAAVGFAKAAPLSGVARGSGTLKLSFTLTNTNDWQYAPFIDLVTLTETKVQSGTVLVVQ